MVSAWLKVQLRSLESPEDKFVLALLLTALKMIPLAEARLLQIIITPIFCFSFSILTHAKLVKALKEIRDNICYEKCFIFSELFLFK